MPGSKKDRLIDIVALGERGATVVEHPVHGEIAVGASDGQPFAVSGRCRHLSGQLGGVFRPVGRLVKDTTGRLPLATYSVELRKGAIWLTSEG
jgi:hypothetical protein